MSPKGLERADRIDFLDSIRGLAALSVVASHYVLYFGMPPRGRHILHDTPLHIWWDGKAAVSMFFVLSGMVLSLRYFRKSTAPDFGRFSYAGFFAARVCRIAIPYLIILFASAIVYRYSAQGVVLSSRTSPWGLALWAHAPSLKLLVHEANLFRMSTPDESYYTLVPQAWTLSIELILSLLVPCAVLLTSRGGWWLIAAAAICVPFGGLSMFGVHFALGVLLARYNRQITRHLSGSSPLLATIMIAGVLLYASRFILPASMRSSPAIWYATGLGSAAIIAATCASKRVAGLLSGRIARHIGRISYSLYLSHLAVLLCLTPRLLSHLPVHGWVAFVLGLVFTAGFSCVISDFLYRLVEVPSMELGRYLNAKISSFRTERNQDQDRLVTAGSFQQAVNHS